VFASQVLAEELKCQAMDLCRKRPERDLETPGAGHHASDWHEGGHLLGRLINVVRQPPWAVRPNRHLIATADGGYGMRERPDDWVRNNKIVERCRRFEIEGMVGASQVSPE
jgi:hypothetical protein